jgi:ABC-type transport system involved in multi-copper enzyme maturation permease subunit
MPAAAVFRYELGGLLASWLVRLWLIAAVILTLLILASNWGRFQSAPLIASLLFPYLVFPWFLPAMVLGISPVTGSRLDALADGILSRPITRHEYLLAAWVARVAVVLASFLIVVVPAALLAIFAERPVAEDQLTIYGVCASLLLVCLVLTFLVSLGFLLGTLLRRPLLAAVILVFTWLPINLVLNIFALEEFSPISLNAAIPTLLRTPWRESNETESADQQGDAQALAEMAARFESMLSGQSAPRPSREQEDFFNRRDFEDFSATRVTLGYGIPTLIALGLASFVFYRRDL